MFINDIDIASYADDTTPYVSWETLGSTVKTPEEATDLLFIGFNYNQMKINEDK